MPLESQLVCEGLESTSVCSLRPSPQSRPICPLTTSSPPSSSSRRSASRLALPYPNLSAGTLRTGTFASSTGTDSYSGSEVDGAGSWASRYFGGNFLRYFISLHTSGKVTRFLQAFQGEGGQVGEVWESETKGRKATLFKG